MVLNITIIILLFITIASFKSNSSLHHVLVRNKRQEPTDTCTAPSITNGKFEVLSHNYRQGKPIPNYASVKFMCNKKYALFSNKNVISCVDGSWNSSVPECKLTCPPLTSTSVDIVCTYNNKTVSCSNPVIDGTIAKCACKEFYVSLNTNQFSTTKCARGEWDKLLIECVPDCGEGVPKGVTYIVNSPSAKFGDFPWHVAVYRLIEDKHTYQCGGSIISPRIILSAAHCFTDNYGEMYSAELYYIGAGKYYSAYDAPNDKLAQMRQVKEFNIPQYYTGFGTNFQADLAAVVLKTELQLTSVVRPVCVDWNRKFERQQLLPDARGTVVGWGYVDPTKPEISEDLKKLTAPYVNASNCLAVVPREFNRWVTPDKYCAGYTNGSSVCQGDSGGGMVFPWTVNNKIKYYLRGIVSVGPFEMDVCNSHQYGVYTQVTHYSDFVQDVIANNSEVKTQAYITSSYGSCRIPALKYGKFFYLNTEYTEGYRIPNYSYLRIYCNDNYKLYPKNDYLLCTDSTWHIPVPKCKKTCPPLISSLANVSCKVEDKTLDCSGSVVEGTVAKVTCKHGSKIFLNCGTGFWSKDDPFKKCEQELMECTEENPTYCNTTSKSTTVRPPLHTNSCPEPKIENGKYEVLGQEPGSYIPNYSIVKIMCNKNYSLTPPNTDIFCINGDWHTKVPECRASCLPRISTSSVDIICTVDDIPVDCSKPLAEGTVAKSSCKRFYTYDSTLPTQSSVSVCIGGLWDNPPIQCVPECGNGVGINESPWHVGIYLYEYDEYSYHCSGSIISPSFVITAAYCVTSIEDVPESTDTYSVVAGKYYTAYNSPEDHLAQIRQVKEFHIPPLYKEHDNDSQADLAVIIVKKSFEITNVVQPVCVDWNREFEKEQLKYGSIGKLISWRYDTNYNITVTFEPFTAPFIETAECLSRIVPSRDFIHGITPDTFCTGFTNESGACAGDSGGGLVFPWKANNNERYYVTGIFSSSIGGIGKFPKCDIQLAVFTRISFYTDWIQTILTEHSLQD